MIINPIAHIKNDYKCKFAIPRQSGINNNIKSKIIFEKDYQKAEAIKGIEGFSHLWLIWGFSENVRDNHSLTVRPPRLGGNTKVGVFASRSPFRPNNLGLSSVKLEGVEYDENNNICLIVTGADLMNKTEIYDIKPYIKFTDSHEDAISGFVDDTQFPKLNIINAEMLDKLDNEIADNIKVILSSDPRPAYQNDESRIYGFEFGDYNIKFKVKDSDLTVVSIDNEWKRI